MNAVNLHKSLLFGLFLFATACSPNTIIVPAQPLDTVMSTITLTESVKTGTPTPVSKTPTQPPDLLPTLTATPQQNCAWPPTIIANAGSDWSWVTKDELLFYAEDQWWIYNVVTRQKNGYTPDADFLIPSWERGNELARKFGVASQEDISLSPDGQSVIYTLEVEDDFREVYVKKQAQDAILIGKIYGMVDQFFWLEGDHVLIAIGWQLVPGTTDAYVYTADLAEKKIEILIPTKTYENVYTLGVSPDSRYLLFRQLKGDLRSVWLWDLSTGEVRFLNLQTPIDFAWVPGKNQFMAVGRLRDEDTIDIYIYD